MGDPVTWLDALIVLAVYLVASVAHRAICAMLRARETFRELDSETGDEAAPERPDDASAEPTRAVCTPAASSPQTRTHCMCRKPKPVDDDYWLVVCKRCGGWIL